MKKSIYHEMDTNKIKIKLSNNLIDNINNFEMLFKNCDDLVKRKFPIGKEKKIWMYISYIDVMIDRRVIEESILEQLIVQVRDVPKEITERDNDLFEFIKDGGVATADIKELKTMDEVCLAVLSGDTILFIDGYNKALMIATKGFPNRGIQEPDTESVIRGSKEGFCEAFRFNTVLIRRRIRDTKLKIKQKQIGTRTRTDIALVYLEDVARDEIVSEIERRLNDFLVDGVLESGILEQHIEKYWWSPFPQAQVTQRPDTVAAAILEGRVAIIIDNTPFVLLLPVTINCFFQSSEDYYHNYLLMSFVRIIRYGAAFLSISLPGLYIALTCFHPAMIPTSLTYSISAARDGVPFPTVVELLILELEFELLREAGVRLPGPIGNTIGIVGGLIIGQAAVSANLVSEIVVVVVALTAIASFAIPSYSLTGAYRILKYFLVLMCASFGLYGFWLGFLTILIHLTSLKSLGVPYLSPYVASTINNGNDIKDTIIKLPVHFYKRRPVFSKKESSIRLKIKKKSNKN